MNNKLGNHSKAASRYRAIAFSVTVLLFFALPMNAAAASYIPGSVHTPATAFGQTFVAACEGEQWLLDETERILNQRQDSIDYLTPGSLSFITSLGVRDKGIVGKIPRAIGYFENLEYLFLSGNQFSGSIPDELYGLTKLRNIDLSNNRYTGSVPTGFSRLPKLEVLRLSGNGYTGVIPTELTNISTLKELDLSANC